MRQAVLALIVGLSACGQASTVERVTEGWQKLNSPAPFPHAPPAVLKPGDFEWISVEPVERLDRDPQLIRVPVRGGAGRAVYVPLTPFSMRVYCGGRLIHAHSDEHQFRPGRFTGWAYHLIDTKECTDGYIYFHLYTEMAMRFVVPHESSRADLIRYIILNSFGPFVVIIVCFALALAFLFPMLARGDLMSGSLSLFLFCTGTWLFTLNPVSRLFVRDLPAWTSFTTFCLFLSPAGVSLFVRSILPAQIFWPSRSAAIGFLVFAVLAMLLDLAGLFALHRTILPFNLLSLGLASFTIVQLVRGVWAGSPEARILAAGIAVLLFFAVHDMALVFSASSGVLELRVSRLHYGMLGFVLSMAGVAAYRWRKMQHSLEDYSRSLELRVQERTAHLEKALREIRAADDKMREELAVASGIQKQLLLPLPLDLPGLRFSGRYIPMHDVSGDFYDIFSLDGRQVVFLFADATGHGVPAALIMSMLKAIFIESAPLFDDPAWILAHMNHRLEKNLARTGNYVTASVLILSEDGACAYANAGQRPCIHLRPGKQPRWIDAEGLILGAFAQQAEDYSVVHFRLEEGERILFYTDGITECEGPAGHLASVDGLSPVTFSAQDRLI
jgi:serine phosphatase RsbU (regulator of sigma subunit)